MNDKILNILLAEDDQDDCLLFKEVLEELAASAQLTVVHNGEQLMQLLDQGGPLPDILFLDLNMPRKNGFACLEEIKQNEKLKDIPIVAISTSFEQDMVTLLYKKGVQHYIRKPNEFSLLKKVIQNALKLTTEPHSAQPLKENFVISDKA